jgi:hypothetical protein
MKLHRLVTSSVIACASSLALAACSFGLITDSPAAATSAGPAVVAGHTATAGASPSAPGDVNFQMMTTSGTTKTIPVIAWGLFTAAGTDHENQSGANGTVHTFAFSGGTFQLSYHLPSGVGYTVNPQTCLSTGSGNGTYTLSGGTGEYKGISGSGHYTVKAIEIQAKANGSCSSSLPPVAFQLVITASGPVKLP